MAKTKLIEFERAVEMQWGKKEEECQNLSLIEKGLLDRHLLMKIGGKHNQNLHVSITSQSRSSILNQNLISQFFSSFDFSSIHPALGVVHKLH